MTTKPVRILRVIPPPTHPRERRVPSRAFPPYRFVPGLNPHPMRHAEGHMAKRVEATWQRCDDWRDDTTFLHACDLFDHRYYWESHEVWEGMWHQLDRTEPLSHLVQGLIQSAASLLKHHVGHHRGCEQLHTLALAHFDQIREDCGDHFYGMSVVDLVSRVRQGHKNHDWVLLP